MSISSQTVKILHMQIKRLYYRFVKDKKLKTAIILLVLVGVIFGAWALTHKDALRGNRALLSFYRQVQKLSDIVYLPYLLKKDSTPTYELFIAPDQIRRMNESLPKGSEHPVYTDKLFVPAEFRFEGRTYNVEVRYRGDEALHWTDPKRSYLVKFDNNDPFLSQTRISFILIDDRKFALEQFNNWRAGKFGLFYPQSGFANFRINGRNNGLYFMIENWSEEMLAKWEVPDAVNFYSALDLPALYTEPTSFGFWDNLDGWQHTVEDARNSYEHYSDLDKLLEQLHETSDEDFFARIFDLVDKENFMAWQVHQQLMNSVHQNYDNVRLFFDNSKGKFIFVPWDVSSDPIGSDNSDIYSALAGRIFENPEFVFEKNKAVYRYVSEEKNLTEDLAYYDETYRAIQPSLYKDRMKVFTNRSADKMYRQYRQEIIDNFQRIKDNFEKDGVILARFRVGPDNGTLAVLDLDIESDADYYLRGIQVELDDKTNLSDFQFIYDINQNNILDAEDRFQDAENVLLFTRRAKMDTAGSLQKQITHHRFFVTGAQISAQDFARRFASVTINLDNAITGAQVNNDSISIRAINEQLFRDFERISDIGLFISENTLFQIDSARRTIALPPGNYTVDKTIIIPRGMKLRVAAGTTLRLAPDTSIISYSPVEMAGTPTQPIVVAGSDPSRPWGTFGVVSAGEQSVFRNTIFRDGKDAYINGIFFIGMLSSYYSDILVDSSQFSGARGDDAINVKSAKATVTHSRFVNNSSDAVDLDFIKTGELSSNEFIANGNDGVDLSGSSVLVRDNYFERSGDKGISIGEMSLGPKIYNNVFNGCNIGVEIKDGSTPKIINNVFFQNKIGLNAYVKKPIFGGGTAQVFNSIIWENGEDFKIDDLSRIEIYNSAFRGSDSENGNFSAPPDFEDVAQRVFTISRQNGNVLFMNGGNSQILRDELGIDLAAAPVGLNR